MSDVFYEIARTNQAWENPKFYKIFENGRWNQQIN